MERPSASVLKRLQSLRVADLMEQRIVVVPWCATMDLAAALLSEAGVSGAPVVDDIGRCLGMLSATDFLAFEMQRPKPDELDLDDACEQPELSWDSVCRYMTPMIHLITPHEPLAAASQLMCAEQVHRLFVFDDQHVPIGVVSSLDVLAAMYSGADEAAQHTCSETIDSREAYHEPVRQSAAHRAG